MEKIYGQWTIFAVLRRRNYLFSATTPAPPLCIISAPAPPPAPAIYCHLKLFFNFYNSIVPYQLRKKLIYHHSGVLQTDCSTYLLKIHFRLRLQVSNNFGSTGSATLDFWQKNVMKGRSVWEDLYTVQELKLTIHYTTILKIFKETKYYRKQFIFLSVYWVFNLSKLLRKLGLANSLYFTRIRERLL